MGADEQDRDPSSILRAIDDDQQRAQRALTPNATLLYATWGIAWAVGFLAFYAAFFPVDNPLIPFAVGAAIGGVALVAAIVFSAVHSARRGSGSRGPSVVQGAIYGNIFPVAFTLMGLLGWRLTAAGVPALTMLSYWVAVPCLIVGILFLAGAAMWNERSQLVFGCWTFIVGLVSIALPPPHNLLAGAAGGIGFLVVAVVQSVRPQLTSGPITRSTDG
ncbi:hypothetical protein [Microbacterium invictum]|uniref:Uncharacterized protein n=1 Tax=Microbacterium invictum TaxID=515415 RepID=A0AA40SSB4_9MICO|nr:MULTISPECIES: hypothetical protein [Microbacterium]MBB4141339.1 hypothetical protein [Microbacterium invictum]